MKLKIKKMIKSLLLSILCVFGVSQNSTSQELLTHKDPDGTTYYSCTSHGQFLQNEIDTSDYEVISSSCVSMWQTHANNFGMRSKDWKNGWGFNSCTESSPLKRTLKSLELIKISKNSSLSNNKIINYMYDRAASYTSRLRPKCSKNATQGAVGSFFFGTINIYAAGLDEDLMYLTSIITHEARHAIKSHNAGFDAGECEWGGSCDTTFDYYGANAYELAYLWAYGVHSKNSTTYTRDRALQIASRTNLVAFEVSPNFNIPVP